MHTETPTATSNDEGKLWSASFTGLLLTQFLGALNDNLFRWLAVPIAQSGETISSTTALSLGLACFTLPYLLLASPAGYLADRFSKRQVIVYCKVAEIVLMLLGGIAILTSNVIFMFIVVALMGAQSALFGPAKYASLPELVPAKFLSKANGWMGLMTVAACAFGTIGGYALFSYSEINLKNPVSFSQIAFPTAVMLAIAVAGWMTSLMIQKMSAGDPSRRFPVNPFYETWNSLAFLKSDIPLLRTTLGIAFFWMLASLAQMNIDPFGEEVLGLNKTDNAAEIGILMAALVVGSGLGSVLAGFWSGGKVELGIVPLGALGITISSLLLFWFGSNIKTDLLITAQASFFLSSGMLFLLGISSGLFSIPLEAYLQYRSPPDHRGMILAAGNFITFSFMMFSSALFYLIRDVLSGSPSQVFLIAGLGTVPVIIYVVCLLPDATIRFLVWLLSHSFYRLKVHGQEYLPARGGALLVPNHVSWIDGIVLLLTSSRPIRMLAYADYVNKGSLRWLAKIFEVIPIKGSAGPKAILQALQTAKDAIQNGELVCIFAEGSLTRSGQLQSFQRGALRIVQGTDAPIIPVYLDELWGSIFSFRGGKYIWKWPRSWPYTISVFFGKPITNPEAIDQVRQAVSELGAEAAMQRKKRHRLLPLALIRSLRRCLFREKVADSSGASLTGGKLLTGMLVMRRLLNKYVLTKDDKFVGVLVPPSVGAVVVNGALALMQKVAVNLNYTLTDEVNNHCIKNAEIKRVLTSRRFLEKKPMSIDAEIVLLEDLKEKVTLWDKLVCLFCAFLLPSAVLERMLQLNRIQPDDLLTIIFTSGSTGEPKGVMLTQYNIASNVEAVNQIFQITKLDVLLGILPFFHSFGYTGNLWLALALDPKLVMHVNPLDARLIGKLCHDHNVTILMATPTFLRSYLKRCDKEQMHALNLVVVGAEKLPVDLAKSWEEKFGFVPTEGFGTTELSPVVSANIPANRAGNTTQLTQKLGTIGRPIPGVSAKIVDPDTFQDLGHNQDGLLWIKGPNVMLGYLHQPEKTAAMIRDGWYNTGDIAKIDDDGFISITGRLSRFSKIGGEMVPHLKIEELIAQIVDTEPSDEPDIKVAVTAVADEKKGERLIVLHKKLTIPVDQIIKSLSESGLPNLWIPSHDSFFEVEQIPILGTGKLDLKGIQTTAKEMAAKMNG
ncbi:MAG: acyl-[ACP]--phospholipid O-acyltransferase [Planctomycetaceae bacterium]